MKACRTISDLSLAKNLLIRLILSSQKNVVLQDLEIMGRHGKVRVKPGAKIAILFFDFSKFLHSFNHFHVCVYVYLSTCLLFNWHCMSTSHERQAGIHVSRKP